MRWRGRCKDMRTRLLPVVITAIACASVLALVFWLMPKARLAVSKGTYKIDEVILSRGVDGRLPIDVANRFDTVGPIYCTVTTIGADRGIVGMRWLHAGEVIYEVQGKTREHTIISYIEGTPADPLLVGPYRVEIFILKETVASADFEVTDR